MDTQHPAVTFSNLTAVTKLLKKTNREPQSQLKELINWLVHLI